MRIKVFIQNEAGSNRKNSHDEKTLAYKSTQIVSCNYPFPYGFVLNTNSNDGCNLDCFVITKRPLATGQVVECDAIALMEQFEDGLEDHNVLAKLVDESIVITPDIQSTLIEFVSNVFRHVAGKQVSVGRFLDSEATVEYVTASSDAN